MVRGTKELRRIMSIGTATDSRSTIMSIIHELETTEAMERELYGSIDTWRQ